MSEPEVCPQCGGFDDDAVEWDHEWERFDELPDELTARESPGKRCTGCGFAVYEVDPGQWAW